MSTSDTTTEAFANSRPSSPDALPDYAPVPRSSLGLGEVILMSSSAKRDGVTIQNEIGAAAEVTGSFARLRLDSVEVAHGVAVVLPLLLEDHVQAREGGLLVLGVPRVRARRGQLV
jgi:hypothetical protein